MHHQDAFSLASADLSLRIDRLGARIRSIRHLPSSVELLAQDGAADPSAAPRTEIGWAQRFAGGWNVLLPHAGEERHVDGVHHEFHGEAARRNWTVERSEGTTFRASLVLRTVPFALVRTIALDDEALVVSQRVQNLSDAVHRFAWVEHPAFAGRLFDRVPSVTVGTTRIAVAALGGSGFSSAPVDSGGIRIAVEPLGGVLELTWDPSVLPHAHVWQERRGSAKAPWFGRVDSVALEPASHPPGAPPAGLGPLVLHAGATVESSLTLRVLRG